MLHILHISRQSIVLPMLMAHPSSIILSNKSLLTPSRFGLQLTIPSLWNSQPNSGTKPSPEIPVKLEQLPWNKWELQASALWLCEREAGLPQEKCYCN